MKVKTYFPLRGFAYMVSKGFCLFIFSDSALRTPHFQVLSITLLPHLSFPHLPIYVFRFSIPQSEFRISHSMGHPIPLFIFSGSPLRTPNSLLRTYTCRSPFPPNSACFTFPDATPLLLPQGLGSPLILFVRSTRSPKTTRWSGTIRICRVCKARSRKPTQTRVPFPGSGLLRVPAHSK
jgi:hypothetical protein